jgi:cytochrome c biogenesis protein CcmG/thiol:disulfide interchange protein DsbE
VGQARGLSHNLLLGVACLFVAGCHRPPPIPFQPVNFEEFQRRLAGLRGHVVVVDVWATWCVPCIERFPRMVEMDRRYRDRGVRFVSLSVDNREDKAAVEEARRFLQKQNASFDHYLLDENILQAFEKLDILGIPAVFLYDRAGRRRYRLTGDDPNHQFTEKDIEQALSTLTQPPP